MSHLLSKNFLTPLEKTGEDFYDSWNADVIQAVTKDRGRGLLLYNVKDGWEPLCAFLGKKQPKTLVFPHVNERETFPKWFTG